MSNELNDQVLLGLSLSLPLSVTDILAKFAGPGKGQRRQKQIRTIKPGRNEEWRHGKPARLASADTCSVFSRSGAGDTTPEPCTHQPPSPRHPSQIQSARPRYTHCNHLRRDAVATFIDIIDAVLSIKTIFTVFDRCGKRVVYSKNLQGK